MPHDLFHGTEAPEPKRLAGWAVILPFTFDNAGRLMARYDNLVFAAHLAMPYSDEKQFAIESQASLADPEKIAVKATESENPATEADAATLELTGVQLDQITSQHSVREAETIWVFRGVGAGTSISLRPPRSTFADWGKNGKQLYGWNGTLTQAGNVVAQLAYARLEWSRLHYFTAAQFAAPSGVPNVGSLFNNVKGHFAPTVRQRGKQVNKPGVVAGELVLEDGRRAQRKATFLGNTPAGQAQVRGAAGAIWLGYGSFLSLTPEKWTRLAGESHATTLNLANFLGDQELWTTMDLANEAGAKTADDAPDLLFEGLSLWGLNDPGQPADPALL